MTDQEDYARLLEETGISEETVRSQSECVDDQIHFESDNIAISESEIQGRGVFATKDFPENTEVVPTRIENKRTPAGRFTNHSIDPNAKMELRGNSVLLVTTKAVKSGEELTVNYRQVLTDIHVPRTYQEKLDLLERELVKLPLTEIPTNHRFVKNPGMYIREAFAPKGTILTSKIHKTDHPFVMMCGEQSILEPDGEWHRIQAPFMGITRAGSRRVVLIHSETVMVTFHATEETDLNKVEEELFEQHDAHLCLEGKDLDFVKSIQRGPQSRIIAGELK